MEKPTIEEALIHFGVKGMKWGVRKKNSPQMTSALGEFELTRKTSRGETITVSSNPPTNLHKALFRVSSKYRENYKKSACMSIKDSSGKKIGDAVVHKTSDTELNLVWISINKTARGNGYATAVLSGAKEQAAKKGFKKLTLEVPGISPDARHIYEKMGFKVTKEASEEDRLNDPTWGGLTEMEYVIPSGSKGRK